MSSEEETRYLLQTSTHSTAFEWCESLSLHWPVFARNIWKETKKILLDDFFTNLVVNGEICFFNSSNCSKRNHPHGISKHARICLPCKMRSGREKQAIGKIKLTSSWPWIVFDVRALVNYHIVRLTGCGILAWLFKSCLNAPESESISSLGDVQQEMSLGVRLLEKIVEEEKGIFST